MAKFIKHDKCPRCGSEDNLAFYDTNEHCFTEGCGYHKVYGDTGGAVSEESTEEKSIYGLMTKPRPIPERGIDVETVTKFKVSVSINPDRPEEAVFPRFKNGEHVANQVRFADKKFKCEGKISGAELFGQDAFPAGGKYITVTEGYYDAMSGYQLTGHQYPYVGVMSASSAKKEVVDNFEYLDSFETIVVNFDNDEPGQKAAKEVAQLFSPGKVKILKLDKAKDASDYLQNGWVKAFEREWWRAPVVKPEGLLLGTEMWESIENHKDPFCVPYPWKGLNDKTYGLRTSEMVLLLADTGVGKTSVCKAIEHNLLKNQDLIDSKAGVGLLHFEEPKYDTAIGLMSIELERPLHLPDTPKTMEEMRSAYDSVVNTDRLVIYDHFGSNDIDVVLAKIRHMAALGCRYFFVDHLTIIVSDQSGDERKQLDEISTKIKTLTMNLDIAVICVIHINRQGQVRGSAGPEQVSNIIMRLERDKKDINPWRRNVTKITIEKNRFCGRTGPACYLYYDEDRGVLVELSPEMAMTYEGGGNDTGNEFAGYD